MLFLSTALLALTSSVFAIPTSSPHVTHEKRNDGPYSLWARHSRAQGHEVLPVRIGLKQRNLEHAERFIQEVSDPSSPHFGKHWSADKIANVFAPAKETSDNVVEWLVNSGIDVGRIRHSTGRNWLEINATTSEAEHLFQTEYHWFQHKESDGYRIACDSYGLPAHVKDHIDFVMPTIQLEGLKPIANARPAIAEDASAFTGLTGLKNCSGLITIQCLRALYGFPAGHYNHSGNQMGIAEWADYLYLPDLKPFFANWTTPTIPADTVPEFISIDGGKRSNLSVALAEEVVESALDFQSAYSIIYPQNTRLYQNGDSVNVDSTGTFNIFLDALDASYCTYEGGDQPYIDPAYPDPNEGGYTGPLQCGGAPKSNVISISYGQIEAALPHFYQQRQCHEWMKLALQGTSVVVSSGDSGVANRYNAGYNNSCVNSTYGFVDTYGDRFSPSFPVNCPYITAVGASFLKSNNLADGEVAVASPDKNNSLLDYYSGGGFSDVFAVPSYQKSAVDCYLRDYAPKYGSNVFNNSGNARAFPDVSAIGLKVATVYLNRTLGVGGTSASAPIFGGIITLLNEERLAIGKKPIGFLNPVMYAHPEMFHDVTEGGNPGCGTDGFPASPGWDPVTGLGTPNYPKMKKVFLELP